MHPIRILAVAVGTALLSTSAAGQRPSDPDWSALHQEILTHFQALVQFDTTDPPGGEEPAAEYLRRVLTAAGIPVQVLTLEPGRPNVVARLAGSGTRRPVLMMAHTDTVNVDPGKWTHPPFSAARDGGYIYGRGTVDDKDNVAASLMTMLLLKRLEVPLDRDVIFLAEAGEEGATRVGIRFMVEQHFPGIDAEYCIAEGGGIAREEGRARYARVQTAEKIPRGIELVARGPAGHGSVPLTTNAVVRLSAAVTAAAAWRPPVRLNETTGAYFKRLAELSTPEQAARYRDLFSFEEEVQTAAFEHLREHEPAHASMLITSISPNIIQAGYRSNVIPSEATARLDVRFQPGENPEAFLDALRREIDDPAVEVRFVAQTTRPAAEASRLETEAFAAIESAVKRVYGIPTLPAMSTGATDMSYLRAQGIQCYGIGPAIDIEDGPKGFGAHSDQERILESELYRFVQLHYEIIRDLAASR